MGTKEGMTAIGTEPVTGKTNGLRPFLAAAGRRAYNALPDPVAAAASEIAYRVSSRPKVYHSVPGYLSPSLKRAAVVFSIDFELAWAWRFAKAGSASCVERALHERAMVPRILHMFERYGVPATWATVGHLFLERCSRGPGGRAHEELPRCGHFETARWKFEKGDWYQHDPCSDLGHDPAWYAPDLIEKIIGAHAGHELGCHTFSHTGFGPYCDHALALAELGACQDAMKSLGVRPTSFVFPGNEPGNFHALVESGYRAVRWYPETEAEIALPARRPDGLWALHSSLAVESRSGRANCAVRFMRLKSYLARAMDESMVMHVWFHPSFLPVHLEQVLEPFVRYCAGLREQGKLDVFTMAELADAADARLGTSGGAVGGVPGPEKIVGAP